MHGQALIHTLSKGCAKFVPPWLQLTGNEKELGFTEQKKKSEMKDMKRV